ncbi:MAG: leucine-rich repeat protein [Clostridiales bacterium]|nr:leucine-rich repeat protein [Clostridiales bacterium]
MTNTARKSLNKKIILVLMAALLALILALQVMYAPAIVSAPKNSDSKDTASVDTMNGVSVKYTQVENGLAGEDHDYKLNDTSVSSASQKATPAPSKEVDVIISLEGTSMMDYAASKGLSVAKAAATADGKKNLENLSYIRESVASDISNYIIERRYDYSTVMNAFSATVRYGDIAAIERNGKVKNVIISETYLAPQTVTENYVDVYETGIFNSEGVGFDGTGTVVAVVDTGTDYTHEVFNMELNADTLAITKDDVAAVASTLAATSLSAAKGDAINEDDLYLTSKLPYAYDYADSDANVYPHESHGTHVAGIIAGKSKTITGVAPGAQIATIKVFSDYTSGAKTEWIMAGLNDAVALGVDAINMSLGSSCGFSREVDEEIINKVYDSINDAGICLVVAASNDASSAQSSTWGNTNLAGNPDSGTVGSPGSYNAALSVGSVSGVKTKYFITDGEEKYFAESRLVGKTDPNDFVGGLLGDKTEGEFEYVLVPGVGMSMNYDSIDVEGKIALVKRGTNNFEDKVRIAASKGAAGVIVYNNVSGTISMSVGSKEIIPSCFITMDYAESMVAAGSGTLKLSTSYLAGPFMSDFSSWGCLPNLILAPDITAHGGEIYSAIPGGDQYDRMSGTSMACPNLAGALILVREFVKEKERQASTTAIRDESYSRMMSTATIVKNEQGNPYSPRKQGAGIADISHSINSKAYLTVDGLNKPKLSLGDDPSRTGKYELKFNLVNDSGSAISYALDQYVMTESMSSDDRTVLEKAHLFTDTVNSYSVKARKGKAAINGNSISLSGYGEAEITVNIELSSADKQYLDSLFANGMFVEGYVMLKSRNTDGIDLNIPYLAFYGDWADAPMLDVSEYEVGESAVDDSILPDDKLKADVHGTLPYAGFYSAWSTDNIGYYGMGAFAFNLADGYAKPVTQEKFAALTNNSDGDYMLYMINAGLLRNAKHVDMEIRNSATGELVWSGVDYNSRKSHSSGGDQTGGMILIELDIRELDLPNNAKYTFNMTCYLDWKKDNSYITDYDDQMDKMAEYKYGNKNTFSFEFTIDNEAPQIASAAVRKTKNRNSNYEYSLEMRLFDNHYMQGYGVYTYGGKETINGYERLTDVTSLKNGLIPVDGEFNTDTLCTLDISGYWDKIMENGGKLYVTLYDYAKNSSSFELVISEVYDETSGDADMIVTPKDDLTITKNRNVRDDYTIQVNEQLDFSTLLTVMANINDKNDLAPVYQTGYWMKNLVWNVEDPTVADITNEGVLTGLKEGETTLTVHTPNVSGYDADDPTHSLKFKIIVSGELAGGLKISGVELSSTTLNLERGETAVISAKIKPYTYTGDVTINWSTNSANNVSITVLEDGMSVEIKALKSGSAKIQANVVGAYTSGVCEVIVLQEFAVSDNIYLRSYTGRGGDWVNEKGEVEHNVVEIPDDLGVAYIYPSAFYGNEYIEKVIIPEGVTSIMRATFFNCTNLREVVLPESLKTIEYMAFANCNKLEKINLGNVQSIGDSAFWGCAMEELDLSKCTYIDKYAFVYNSNLKKLDLSRVGMIGGGAFAHCNALTSVTIPENTSMGYDTLYLDGENGSINRGGAFAFCTNLKSVIIKSRSVGESAFFACINLESVIFENDVNEIGVNAFAHCYELQNVTFYGSVYKIDGYAFMRCESLKEITLPDGLTIMGSNVFLRCDKLATVKVSSGALLDTISIGSLGGLDIAAFEVENGNKYLSSEDGVLYDRAKKKLIAYPNAREATDYAFTVPATVKTIGESAFAGVSSLYTINLNNVEYIEAEAFRELVFEYPVDGRYLWVQFNQYNNVKYIGDYAFCRAAIDILPISDTKTTHIGNAAFYGASLFQDPGYAPANSTIVIPRNLEYLGEIAFAGLVGITNDGDEILLSGGFTNVSFAGSSIKKVGAGAFAYNPALATVNFGNLEEISDGMFASCVWTTVNEDNSETTIGLKSVVIPDTIKSIGRNAFADCSELTSVTLPSGLKRIADGAFAGTSITSITLPDSVESIGAGAFEESKLNSITLPSATTAIGDSAFAKTPLTEVNYKSGKGAVKTIGNSAFESCDKLTYAEFPLAETIGNNAFRGCKGLQTVNFAAVKSVGIDAFNGCEALTAVNIANVETIADGAFKGAKGVSSVNMPKIQKIGAEAFSGTSVTTIELPAGFIAAADKAFYGAEKLEKITVDEKNTTYKSLDGVLYSVNDKGMYSLISYPAGKTDKIDYAVYDKTIKLNAYAFNGNKTLKSVTLPAYLKVIGISAMSGMSSLTSLTINAVDAPTLESYATMVEVEKEDDDESSGTVGDDDVVGDDDIENDNEFVDRNEYVFTNKYDNFNFAFEDAGETQQLKIYIPYNNSGYDSRIWKQYVGQCLVDTDKVHVSRGTLEFIESIQAELEKTTHDADEIRRLINIYNMSSEDQKPFINGNYKYDVMDKDGNIVASIDTEYYTNVLKGRDYYSELSALQSRANASSMSDDSQYSVASVTADSTLSVVVIAALSLCIVVVVATYSAKRRDK